MERITISLEESLAARFDLLVAEHGYQSRSEVVRSLIRQRLNLAVLADEEQIQCIASMSFVYKYYHRDLAERLMQIQHEQHAVVLANSHVHLDQDNCLETIQFRGSIATVRRMGEAIAAERGVSYGHINIIPVDQIAE